MYQYYDHASAPPQSRLTLRPRIYDPEVTQSCAMRWRVCFLILLSINHPWSSSQSLSRELRVACSPLLHERTTMGQYTNTGLVYYQSCLLEFALQLHPNPVFTANLPVRQQRAGICLAELYRRLVHHQAVAEADLRSSHLMFFSFVSVILNMRFSP